MTLQIRTPCQSTCQPWALAADLCAPCSDYAFSQLDATTALQVSSDILFELSGRRFAGVCEDTVRPTSQCRSVDHGRPAVAYNPLGIGGGAGSFVGGWGWNGAWSFQCNHTNRDGCNSIPEITLGVYPLDAIMEVKIDGVILDPSKYSIADNRYLVRMAEPDGTNPGWPCCQRMDKATTEKGTWEVTVAYGQPPGPAGVWACAELACQLMLACDPDAAGQCQLPQRVTNVTRQGVSMIVLDPMAFLDKGKTGLYFCDLFLASVNPQKLKRRATAMSPDTKRRVRRTQ